MYRVQRRLVVPIAGLTLVFAGCEPPREAAPRERPSVTPARGTVCPASAEMREAAAAHGTAAVPSAPETPVPGPAAVPSAPEVSPAPEPPPGPVREPTAAGSERFYTSDPRELRRQVSGFVAAGEKAKSPGRVIAIIAPHAGYGFSGPAAGRAYRQLEGEDIDTVVIVGGHAGGSASAAVWPGGAWKTPLGSATVDAPLAAALCRASGKEAAAARANTSVHLAPVMNGLPDHALEVHVPFIQVLFPRARIVPVYFNSDDAALAARVGESLALALKGRKAVIVASTDLSHYPDAPTAAVVDKAILDAIVSLDPGRVLESNRRLMATYRGKNVKCTVCGMGAVLATVEAAKRLGATGARLVAYDHSGNRMREAMRRRLDAASPEDREPIAKKMNEAMNRVVGYGAVAIYGPAAPAAARVPKRMLNDAEQRMLLALARKSIEFAFEGKDLPKLAGLPPALERKAAAFVTLTNDGRLRGCMGTFDRSDPLWQVVAERARTAAFRDPREGLGNVTKEELAKIEIEVSVLSDPRKLEDPLSIELGRDGILLRSVDGLKGGTYLPQVGENFKTKEEFLSHCCAEKAGLPAEAWRDPKQVTVYAYTAEVFTEGELRAKAGKPGKKE